MTKLQAACGICQFSQLVQPDPHILTRVRMCYRMPPTPIATALPGGMTGFSAARPIVADADFCFFFAPVAAAVAQATLPSEEISKVN